MFQGNKKRFVGESRKTKFVESRRTFSQRMINTHSSNIVQPLLASFFNPVKLEDLQKLIPNPRPLPASPKLTVLAISGQSQQGKTSLCELILNNSQGLDFKFISMDLLIMSIKSWCTNPLILKYDNRPMGSFFVIEYNKYINDTCSAEFIEELFSKFIQNATNRLILIEGQFFTYPNNAKQFALACKRHNIRLWFSERLT